MKTSIALPEGAVALMRRLSMKSKLLFGQHPDSTVSETLASPNGRNYLLWCYYNLAQIDFLPEVKEAVGITQEIAKPGTDAALFNSIRQASFVRKEWDEMTAEEHRQVFVASARKKARKRRAFQQVERECRARELSALQLQAINHGHGCCRRERF